MHDAGRNADDCRLSNDVLLHLFAHAEGYFSVKVEDIGEGASKEDQVLLYRMNMWSPVQEKGLNKDLKARIVL